MRFAHERTPEAPRRSFWLLIAGFFLLLAVPVAVFNLIVDPFDFRLVPHAPLQRMEILRRDNVVLWSAGELRRIPKAAMDRVTIVFAGDSRTELITGGYMFPRIFKLADDYVLNLSAGGASFDENVKLLEAELPHLPKLRAVVLAVPLDRIGTVEGMRVDDALKTAGTPLFYALNLGTLARSVRLLTEQSAGASADHGRPDIDASHIVDVTADWLDMDKNRADARASVDAPLDKGGLRAANQWKKRILRMDEALIQSRMKNVLSPLVQRLRKRGVEFLFFLPPLHPEIRSAFDAQRTAAQQNYLAALSKIAPVEDFSGEIHDGIVPRFQDALHVTFPVAQAIMGDIYQRHFAAKQHASTQPAGGN